MLSDVLPNIALQLRTSLSTIYTAVDRMAPQETREKDPKTDRTAAAFYQSYYQLYRVISNLTDAGNLFERKRFELYDDDIVGVCRSVCAEVDFLFAQCGVELDFLADRDSRIIALDAEAIRKLLLNLLSNALKFTPKGGSVRVRVKTEGRFVKITVADTGRGMDSDTLAHLFDRFMDGGQNPMPPRFCCKSRATSARARRCRSAATRRTARSVLPTVSACRFTSSTSTSFLRAR